MAEALGTAFRKRQPAPARLRSLPALGVSEGRRAWNLERIDLVAELRCECALPRCKDWLPAVAETHRGRAGRFIVAPTHANGGVVVKAADRFFVVESNSR